MLSDKEKISLANKIKNIPSTNQKITILLSTKLQFDLKNKNKISKELTIKLKKCDKDIFYLYNIASDMWYLAGDKSSDYNFYTKRIILSGILFKLYFKILTLNNYDEDKLDQDIKEEISKVGKFNKFKSEFLSTFKNFNKKGESKRGY